MKGKLKLSSEVKSNFRLGYMFEDVLIRLIGLRVHQYVVGACIELNLRLAETCIWS